MAEPPAEPQEFETHEEILAWARRHYGRRWLRSLTAEEFEALQALKSDAHAAINA